jgi:hypothetical protein
MTGIQIESARGSSFALSKRIVKDPGDPAVLEEMRELGNQVVLIYVSSVSIEHPGLVPPFKEYEATYPDANYELIYDRGAKIYRLRA